MVETKNAKITSTSLGYESHGILTYTLMLDYGGACQGFGGYALDEWVEVEKKRIPTKMAGVSIQKILETVGVSSWEDLVGTYVRVKAEYAKVHEIGNLLEDKWFNPSTLYAPNA